MILIPLNIDKAHWALGVVDMRSRTTHYLDSLEKDVDFPLFHEYMARYLKDEWQKTAQLSDEEGQSFKSFKAIAPPSNLPLQQNGNDCGIFVSLFGLCLTSGIAVEKLGDYKRTIFSPENLLNARKRILGDIVRGEIVR
jgi:sentrin-specific protease 1